MEASCQWLKSFEARMPQCACRLVNPAGARRFLDPCRFRSVGIQAARRLYDVDFQPGPGLRRSQA